MRCVLGSRVLLADKVMSLTESDLCCRLYAKEPPLPDFQEFVKMAAKNKMLPSWWSKEDNRKMEEMALTDKWANINSTVEKSDIIEQYDSTYPMMLRMIAEHVTGKSLNQ